ncbi:tagaturonate epimerase family protein [bacterium]|nr:tagaturonate epimerase family protein [bacterium]
MNHIVRKEFIADALKGKITIDSLRNSLAGERDIVPESISLEGGRLFMLAEPEGRPALVVASCDQETLSGFSGEAMSVQECGEPFYVVICPLDHGNAARLRETLPRTAPSVLDCRESFGTGDRISGSASATPGHIAALANTGLTPVLAQQSVRENHKTGRTFEQVMDDVTWSVFRTGYHRPWGSDADHLKTMDAIGEAVRAGFTMYTLDPSDLIDNDADTDSDEVIARKLRTLFPDEKGADAFISRYERADGASRTAVARSAVKYLGAVRHAVKAYNRLRELRGGSGFNFELSIDETRTTTSGLDHRIIATECVREGIQLFSLAPRFEGAFEKGIDYRGSLDGFRRSIETHAALARELGGYRLSLHSGSDKFSIYPIFGEVTDGLYHVKTAGTSYLEAVKVAARTDIAFFRRILDLSLETFAENVKSYEISANPANVPVSQGLSPDEAVRQITVNPDMRQVLHIAFGVVLQTMGDELRLMLGREKAVYKDFLVTHIGKHVKMLKRWGKTS